MIIIKILLASISFGTVLARPLEGSDRPAPQFHELTTRSILKRLDKRDQPRLAQNAAKVEDLPVVTLPYGNYRATKYVKDVDIYVFKNIRFAAPIGPGPTRFAPPQPPVSNATVQDGSYGPQCIQTLSIQNIPNLDLAGILNFGEMPSLLTPNLITPILDQLKPVILDLGAVGAIDKLTEIIRPLIGPGGPFSMFPGTIGDLIEALSGVLGLAQAEDCLFLDVYVPGKVIRKQSGPLPVMHWIYGGAYIFGSKDGLYDGFGLIKASNNEMIFVASNYRMGAYGWFAGRTAEKSNATNLALFDQRAALQWTQEYIGLFGGDKARVTAAGESAGAGSLTHHITAYGGQQDPLFKQAILQSPAFQPIFDRDGLGEKVFKMFEAEAGCAGQGIQCLSNIPLDQFQRANAKIIKAAPPGTFSFGPAADGDWVRQLPSAELYSGAYFKGLDSMILSSTRNEPSMFSDPEIDTSPELDQFEKKLLPADAGLQTVVQRHIAQFPDAKMGLRDLVQGSSFGCNVRYLTQAYAGKTYNMQFSKARGTHGADILPTFYSIQNPLTALVGIINPAIPIISSSMQAYFASYVTTGDPNKLKPQPITPLAPMPLPGMPSGLPLLPLPPPLPGMPPMPSSLPPLPGMPPPLPVLGPQIDMPRITNAMADVLGPILSIDDINSLVDDMTTTGRQCDFWKDLELGGTNLLGYAAPGPALMSTMIPPHGDPSRNYVALTSPNAPV